MSTTKFAGGAAAIIAFLALGTAGYQVHAQHAAVAALAAANQNYGALTAKLRDLERRANAAEQRAAELKQHVADAKAEAAAAETEANWNPVAEGTAFLQRQPEVAQAINELGDGWYNFSHAPFFKRHGLTPAQIQEFDKIANREDPDMRYLVWLPWLGKDIVLTQESQVVPRSEQGARLRSLLGDDGFADLIAFRGNQQVAQDRQTELTARRTALQVATGLSFTDTPLTSQQADDLVHVIQAIGLDPSNWGKTDAKAREILSPAQLPVWETLQAERQAKRALTASEASSTKTTPTK